MNFSEFYPDYFTATILEWKHLLKPDKYKDIILSWRKCFLRLLKFEQSVLKYNLKGRSATGKLRSD